MHIVSGSDQEELRYLCGMLEIRYFFKSIHESSTLKKDLVKLIIENNGYYSSQCVLMVDLFNDYKAAKEN